MACAFPKSACIFKPEKAMEFIVICSKDFDNPMIYEAKSYKGKSMIKSLISSVCLQAGRCLGGDK